MTLTATDYALLAQDAYRNREVGELVKLGSHTYRALAKANNLNTGFQATAYEEANEHKVVIAYRGTEPDRDALRDGLVDVGMIFTGLNGQEADSRKFTHEVIEMTKQRGEAKGQSNELSVTGHSLGGTLAEINASESGLPGQTFNAYGAAGLYRDRPHGNQSVINHVRATDLVGAASTHYGEVRIYASTQDIEILRKAGYKPEGSHAILRTVNAINMESHAIDNFIPSANTQETIISPENESRYVNNRALVDHFRSDVEEIRHHASVAWETKKSVSDGVEEGATIAAVAGRRAATEVGHAAEHGAIAIAAGVRATAHAGMAAGKFGSDVAISSMMETSAAERLRGSATGSPELDKLLHQQRIDDPFHPGNTLFKQALEGTQRLDAEQGRPPDKLSTNLAGSLAVAAQRQGMDRIDHVLLSDDASQAYAVQGELSSPFKKIAQVQTELGISASIEQSSKEWTQASAQRQQAELAQATERSQQAAQDQAVPSPGRSLH